MTVTFNVRGDPLAESLLTKTSEIGSCSPFKEQKVHISFNAFSDISQGYFTLTRKNSEMD